MGTSEFYVRLDSTAPTASNAHYIVAACSADNAGDGGFLTVDGVITAMKVGAASSTYKVQIVEYVKA